MTDIQNAKILILATDGFEQSELEVPKSELAAKGATVTIAAPEKTREPGKIKGWDEKDWGRDVAVDLPLSQVRADDYDALVLPGGVINPDKLRGEPKAIETIKAFAASGKVIAAICHAPWLLAEADVIRGRNVTSVGSIKTDVKNAGGQWSDQEVVTDQGIITSRTPKDLPAFVAKIVEEIGEGRHERRAA